MDTSALPPSHLLRQTADYTEHPPHFFLTLNKPMPQSSPDDRLLSPRLRSLCSGDLRHIASGSVSDVYKTLYRGRPAALKVIRCGLDLNRLYRAMRECAMLELVRCCYSVVPLLEYDVQRTDEGFRVLILQDYLTPLDEYCLCGPMAVKNALRITRDLCRTLESCWNAGVAHLDIQPGNLFVSPDGTAMLGDFSSALPVEELKGVRYLRGTPAYMAPEVYREHRYSQASEVYSLGLILYSLLCSGQLPFTAEVSLKEAAEQRLAGAPFRLPEGFDGTLRAFLDWVCARDPANRCPSLQQMNLALEELIRTCSPAAPVIPACTHFSHSDTTLTQSALCGGTVFPEEDGFADLATSRIPPRTPDFFTDTLDPQDDWLDDIAASVPAPFCETPPDHDTP